MAHLDALRLVLEKDPLVDASQVRASGAERDAAEFDGSALFGIDKVINRIRGQARVTQSDMHAPRRTGSGFQAKWQPPHDVPEPRMPEEVPQTPQDQPEWSPAEVPQPSPEQPPAEPPGVPPPSETLPEPE